MALKVLASAEGEQSLHDVQKLHRLKDSICACNRESMRIQVCRSGTLWRTRDVATIGFLDISDCKSAGRAVP